MNREIKFRVWDKVQQVMIYQSDLKSNPWEKCLMLTLEGKLIDMTCDKDNDESNNCILMQFTGLKDKNGIEIYEGDILNNVTYSTRPFIVSWATDKSFYCGFVAKSIEKEFEHLLANENFSNCEVIGNIHQNPELLEQSK